MFALANVGVKLSDDTMPRANCLFLHLGAYIARQTQEDIYTRKYKKKKVERGDRHTHSLKKLERFCFWSP